MQVAQAQLLAHLEAVLHVEVAEQADHDLIDRAQHGAALNIEAAELDLVALQLAFDLGLATLVPTPN